MSPKFAVGDNAYIFLAAEKHLCKIINCTLFRTWHQGGIDEEIRYQIKILNSNFVYPERCNIAESELKKIIYE